MGWFKRMVGLEKPVRKIGWGRIKIKPRLYTREKVFKKQLKKLLVHITEEELATAVSRLQECHAVYALVDEGLYRKANKGRFSFTGLSVTGDSPGNCCNDGRWFTDDCSCGVHEDSDRFDYLIISSEHSDESGWVREGYYSG